MPQPACVACRWGTGTTSEKPTAKTPAAQEMEQKLANMQRERQQQDQRWFAPPSAESSVKPTTAVTKNSTSMI